MIFLIKPGFELSDVQSLPGISPRLRSGDISSKHLCFQCLGYDKSRLNRVSTICFLPVSKFKMSGLKHFFPSLVECCEAVNYSFKGLRR